MEYLNRKEVIKQWTGLNLDERAVRLHQVFPGLKLSASSISLCYKSLKIWRKPVQIKKVISQ